MRVRRRDVGFPRLRRRHSSGIFSFIQTLSAEKPDLALIDISMPALNGDKLIEIARKHRDANCLLVLFSNRKPDELAKLAKHCGAAGFIQKTGSAEVLGREVGAFLRARGR